MLRVALGAWLSLALLAAWLLPLREPMAPAVAEQVYGEARSISSAAPQGTLGFAKVLDKLGFEVMVHDRFGPPEGSAALFVLRPDVAPEAEEVALLHRWLKGGGRLIYAPALAMTVTVQDDAGEEPQMLVLDDLLVDAVAKGVPGIEGAGFRTYSVDRGRAVILRDGGDVLSNETLQRHGLHESLPWLRWVLQDTPNVYFDEARLGVVRAEGLVEALLRSRHGGAVYLVLLTVVVWLLAKGVRSMPPHEDPPHRGRIFGEHLDAVADALARTMRVQLAMSLLVQGTQRRLGSLAGIPVAEAELAACRRGAATESALVQAAERLRRLERRFGGKKMGEGGHGS